jgi:hypothetical protein
VNFDTTGGDYFQAILVLKGQPGNWVEVGCGIHGWGWNSYSSALVDVVAGDTYWIVVMENGGAVLPDSFPSATPLTFTALPAAFPPTLGSMTPTLLTGGWDTPLQITGSNFTPASYAVVDTWLVLPTTFVSSTQLTASAAPGPGDHSLAVFTPTPGGGTSTGLPFTVTSFQMNATPSSLTIQRGATAAFTLTVTPHPKGFEKPVQFECFILPPGFTCSFSPASFTPGTDVMTSTLHVTAPLSASAVPGRHGPAYLAWLAAPVLLAGFALPHDRRRQCAFWLATLMLCAFLLFSCGGGGSSSYNGGGGGGGGNQQPVHYPIGIKATSGTMYQLSTVDLVVTP